MLPATIFHFDFLSGVVENGTISLLKIGTRFVRASVKAPVKAP